MIQQRIQNASEGLKRAKEMGEEIFLARYQKVPEIFKNGDIDKAIGDILVVIKDLQTS